LYSIAINKIYWTVEALKNMEIIVDTKTKGIPKEIMFTNKLSL
jgi:hypothetical protein